MKKIVECISPQLRPRREVQRIVANYSDACAESQNCTFVLRLWDFCRPTNAYQGFDIDGSSLPQPTLCEPRLSAPIPYQASRDEMKSILQDLPGVGSIRVTRFSKSSNVMLWQVTFSSELQLGNLPQMEVINISVANSSVNVRVNTLINGTTLSTGRVAVEVSQNNQDYTSSGVTFEYQPIIFVDRILPTHGPLYGGTEIYIFGSNFKTRPNCIVTSGPERCCCSCLSVL